MLLTEVPTVMLDFRASAGIVTAAGFLVLNVTSSLLDSEPEVAVKVTTTSTSSSVGVITTLPFSTLAVEPDLTTAVIPSPNVIVASHL